MTLQRTHVGRMGALRRACAITPAIAAILLATACPADDDTLPDTYGETTVVVDQGEGETNAEPLWTLHPGARFGSLNDPWVVGEPVRVGGLDVFPVGRGGHGTTEGRDVPSEPAWWLYLSQADDGGVLYHGMPREGLTAPALLVPATVRVGMTWRTGRSPGVCAGAGGAPDCVDDPHFTITVTDRTVKDTLFGRRPVWTLSVTDWYRYRSEGKASDDNRILNGVTFDLELVEGRGPRRLLSDTPGERFAAVTPIGPPSPPESLPAIALEPADLPEVEDALGLGLTGYSDPSRFGDAIVVGRVEERPFFGQQFVDLGGGDGVTIAAWGMETTMGCRAPEAATDEDCHHGLAIAVAADGASSRRIVLDPTGAPVVSRPPGGAFEEPFDVVEFLGVFQTPDGAFDVFRNHDYGVQRGELHPDLDLGTVFDVPLEGAPLEELYTGEPRHWPLRLRGTAEQQNLRLGTLVAQPAEGDVRLLVLRGAALHSAVLKPDQTTRAEQRAYPRVGYLNVFARPGGRDMLLSTFGGRVEQVLLEDDGLQLRALGDIEVPDGEFMVGALLVGDELVVATQAGYTGFDAFYVRGLPGCPECQWIDRTIEPQLGRIRFWRAPLPAGDEPRRPAPVWSVEATPTGLDMLVCWAAGHGPPQTDGWTLGGHAPAAVVVTGGEDRCVLLVRDAALPDLLATDSAWSVEGPLPDGTRVAIGTTWEAVQRLRDGPPSADGPFTPAWHEASTPSIGGRLWSGAGTSFEPGGVWETTHTTTFEAVRGEAFARGGTSEHGDVPLVPDLSGTGAWSLALPSGVTTTADAGYVDAEGVLHVMSTEGLGPAVTHISAGGGLLFEGHHLAPDGAVTPLPAAAADVGTIVMRLANGTVCGNGADVPYDERLPMALLCARPGEAGVVAATPEPKLLGCALGGQALLAGDGGAYFVCSGNRSAQVGATALVRLDPDTLRLEEVDVGAWGLSSDRAEATLSMLWTIGEDGVPLAVVTVEEPAVNERRLVRFEAGGPRAVERVELLPYRHVDSVVAHESGGLILVAPNTGVPYGLTEDWVASRWPAATPEVLRMPVLDWQDRVAPADDTADPDDAADGTPCERQAALGPLPVETTDTACPRVLIATDSGDRDAPRTVELVRDDGERIPVPAWQAQTCGATGPCTGFDSEGDTRRWHVADLEPFRRYTAEIRAGEAVTRLRFATGNHGSGPLDLSAGTNVVFDPATEPPGPMLSPFPAVETRVDPARGRGLVTAPGGTWLVERGADAQTKVTSLPLGGVFSPDGGWVLGLEPTAHAYHIASGTFANFPADAVGLERTFSLPEHGLVHVPLADGTGVVLRLEADGTTTAVATTPGADARFSGDGQAVLFVDHAGDAPVGPADLVRLDLDTGETTTLHTFPSYSGTGLGGLRAGFDGRRAYLANASSANVMVYAEGQEPFVAPFDFVSGFRKVTGLVAGGRAPGMLAVVDNGGGLHVVMRYDPSAAPGSETSLIPQVKLEPELRDAVAGVGALAVLGGDAAGGPAWVIRASDGAVLQTFEDVVELWRWPDGGIGVLSDVCPSAPGASCRTLTVLSDDGETVVDTISDAGIAALSGIDIVENAFWPFGHDRDRAVTADGIVAAGSGALLWPDLPAGEHPDSTLDLPCVPVVVSQPNLDLVYDGVLSGAGVESRTYCIE